MVTSRGAKMKKWTVATMMGTLLVLSVLIFSNRSVSTEQVRAEGMPNTADTERIVQTIKRAYELEEKAARTFDTTEFASVFINDPRGGTLDASTIDFVKDVTNNPRLTMIGYLDYKVAYYKWWEIGALQIEALQDKAQAEQRPLSQDELLSLVDSKGRVAMPRAQGPISPVYLEFLSISIDNDVAIVVFDDGPRTNKMILVRVNEEWYIAGNEILSVHP
jgi:hypothetical protein